MTEPVEVGFWDVSPAVARALIAKVLTCYEPEVACCWKLDAGSGRPAAPTAGDLQSLPCRPKLHEASTIAAGRRLHSPALSTGPEFKRTFDPLVERLWAWRDDQMLATVAAVFKERGVPWASVVNALLPENGAAIRAALRQPAWARLPAFAVA